MELLGRKIILGMAGMLLLFGASDIEVNAGERYPILYGAVPSDAENVIMIEEDPQEYEVAKGDSLWKIAERLWGNGEYYTELAECNRELVPEPDLICPGMLLDVGRAGYMEKESGPAGFASGEYAFDFPDGFTVGYLQSGEVGASLAVFGRETGDFACLIQKRMEETVSTGTEWESCIQKIEDYVQENYKDCVSGLTFDHYQVNGEELYLYSYVYTIYGSRYGLEGTMQIYVCAGLRLSEHLQAEYIGFSRTEDISDIVRYMGASFEEQEMNDDDPLSVSMSFFPDSAWDVEGLYDSFSWIDGYFDAIFQEATAEEPNIRERLLGN